MGFRFRKTVRLGGLVRLNFSGSGVSLGLGPRGANVNISRRGVRQTAGLPGTGLSYQSFTKWPDPPPPSASAPTQLTSSPPPVPAQAASPSTGFLKFLGAMALVVFLVSVLGLGKGAPSPPAVTVVPAAPATPAQIPAAVPKAPEPAAPPAANPAGATPPTPPPANTAPLTLEEVREAQTWLKAFLLDPGPLDGLPGPQTAAAVSKYQTARQLRDELEARIVDQGMGMSLVDLLTECEGVDGTGLPGEIAAMEGERKTLGSTIESLLNQRAELLSAFNSLFSGAEAGESRQSAAIVEAEIESLVQRYSDLALQEIVLRQAIDLYRERNQGPILGRAKGLFSELTNGSYAGLRADVNEKNDPILVAEHADRGSLEIDALSDGTVDSLYLALRLAAVQEHNATREPLPFVADDLLLNFDNARSLAAMRILGSMAKDGQVLFFTHHEHMVGLAEAALPSPLLTVHRL